MLALVAVAAEAAFGHLFVFAAPTAPSRLGARFAGALTRRLDRPYRGERTLTARGGLLLSVVAGLAAGTGAVMDAIFDARPSLWPGEAVILASCLQLRRPWQTASAAARLLAAGDVAGAASALAMRGRAVDEHAAARFGIERLCADLVRGLIAPLLWYLLLGLPGALLSTAVAGAARNLGGRRSSPSFARIPQLADRALNLPAALIAAVLIALASGFIPGGRPIKAIGELALETGRRPADGSRWPLASAAGGLGLALGGRSSYAGWIGQGTARATSHDLRRMMLTAVVCCLFAVILLAGLAALSLASRQ